MLTSIRWRLVMGTMLLTLITVSAVGIVALLLMQRYMAQQERAYLAANAEAIAQQAASFMQPVTIAPPLQQLAQTASFLGDVTVRIVDSQKVPVADSTLTAAYPPEIGVAAAPIYFRVAPYPYIPALAAPSDVSVMWTATATETTLQAMPAQAPAGPLPPQESNVIVVQKSPSFWGDRLSFEVSAETLPVTMTMPVGAHVDPWVSKGPMPNSVALFARQEAAVAASVVEGEDSAQATLVDRAPLSKTLVWERKWTGSSTIAQPTIAQPTNLQPTVVQAAAAQPLGPQPQSLQPINVVTAPIVTGGMVVGFVELGRVDALVNEPLGALRDALAVAAGASALLAIAAGLVMSRTLTAPIQNLAQAAAAMSSGDLTARAPVVGRDELASLARQFNQMADALHHSFVELAAERDTLRRFVADASHELRTPITALRTFNELLQGPAQTDHSAQQEFLAESQTQITRLEWITRNLLDLSRWDAGMATLARSEMNLGDLLIETVAPFRALAQELEIELTVLLPEKPILATVDGPRLGLAMANLLDNALKFTPSGGKVELGICQEAQAIKIWVADTGMGIAGEELPHIFARFYRSPRATQAGSGLGLAIVERILRAHHATVTVESNEGVGSRFTLTLVEPD